jgi:glycosyltransferase involved in cell wall biosynthesis
MARATIGYVIRMFPQLSETFVANEIREMEGQGVPLRVFSYRQPREDVPHDCVRQLRTPVGYLPDPLYRHPRVLLGAQRSAWGRDRARYRSVVRSVAARSRRERSVDPWKRLLHAAELAGRVEQAGVARLHAHFAHGATDVALLTSQLTGIPFGFTAHARDIYTSSPSLLTRKIQAAQTVVTCTRANLDHLCELAGPDHVGKIHLVYHGVDLEKFRPAEAPPQTDPPLLLSAGRLVAKKGFCDLLQACARLRKDGVRIRCVIVGEGPERARLERLRRELGLEGCVELPGSASQETLAELYRQARLFALPCQILADGDRDGIPNVLVEAMASGLPVVSSRLSGIPELVEDGANGLLVEQRSIAALAAALARLLDDADLRSRLGRRARADVEKQFDSTANAQWLASLLHGPLGPSGAAP